MKLSYQLLYTSKIPSPLARLLRTRSKCSLLVVTKYFLNREQMKSKHTIKRTYFVESVKATILLVQMYPFANHSLWALIAEFGAQWRTICVGYHQIDTADFISQSFQLILSSRYPGGL